MSSTLAMTFRPLVFMLVIAGVCCAQERPDEFYDPDVQKLIAADPLFATGPIGDAAATTQAEEAFGAIVRKKEAVRYIIAAFEYGTDYSRCYALVALRESSPPLFADAMRRFRKSGPKTITIQVACEQREVALKDFCDAIEAGDYAAFFKRHEERKEG